MMSRHSSGVCFIRYFLVCSIDLNIHRLELIKLDFTFIVQILNVLNDKIAILNRLIKIIISRLIAYCLLIVSVWGKNYESEGFYKERRNWFMKLFMLISRSLSRHSVVH